MSRGPVTEAALSELRPEWKARIKTFDCRFDADRANRRFHGRFIAAGLPLKFQTTGASLSYYRRIAISAETDRQGKRWNFLAAEGDFQFVRSLEQRDLVVPVVGDLAGSSALPQIGQLIASRGERLSAFYASNVEFYLFGDGKFSSYVDNLKRLPHSNRSLIIRSVFGGLGQSAPGYYSSSLVQPVDELLRGYAAGRFRGYPELTISR